MGLFMRIFYRYLPLKPQHNSPAHSLIIWEALDSWLFFQDIVRMQATAQKRIESCPPPLNFHSLEGDYFVCPASNRKAASAFMFSSLAEKHSVTFRLIQQGRLFLCWTKISCCRIQKSRWGIITPMFPLWFQSVQSQKEYGNIFWTVN